MRARVTSPNGGRRERPSEWLEAHLETQPGREPGTPPPVPAPPPGPLSARSYPRPHREPRGGSGRSPRATVVPPPPRASPRGPHGSRDPSRDAGGRASERAEDAGGRCSPIPRSSCCARCPPNPTSSATAGKRYERRPSDHRDREAGRDGDAGTGDAGTGDGGADDRPGTAPAPAPAPAAETHGQTRAAAATAPVCPPALRSVRPPAVLTCAARRHGPAER